MRGEPLALKLNLVSETGSASATKSPTTKSFAKLSPGVQMRSTMYDISRRPVGSGSTPLRVADHSSDQRIWAERRTIQDLLISTGHWKSDLLAVRHAAGSINPADHAARETSRNGFRDSQTQDYSPPRTDQTHHRKLRLAPSRSERTAMATVTTAPTRSTAPSTTPRSLLEIQPLEFESAHFTREPFLIRTNLSDHPLSSDRAAAGAGQGSASREHRVQRRPAATEASIRT